MRAVGQLEWPGVLVAGIAIAMFVAADYSRLRYHPKNVRRPIVGAAFAMTVISAGLMVARFIVLRT
jgi:hypothetical protein